MTTAQVRGMLLEEAILHLLRRSGYTTVDAPGADPTLCNIGAGIAVKGRGSNHQIDAIADFVVHQPFSNPQRLLVEAKCFTSSSRVGIDVVRNAIGVLKDVSEFWAVGPGPIAGRRRYHYQYAIFSASAFTSGTQKYAFAQDLHLFPLARSRYFHPIIEAVYRAFPSAMIIPRLATTNSRRLSELRSFVRDALRNTHTIDHPPNFIEENNINLRPFLEACHRLNYVLVAVLGGRFPILLSPSRHALQRRLPEELNVQIFWDAEGWYLRSGGVDMFSFDLPEELFELYAQEGFLSPRSALDMKEALMSHFQAIETVNNRARIIHFTIDGPWLTELRRRNQEGV